jgi:hypothetical protein
MIVLFNEPNEGRVDSRSKVQIAHETAAPGVERHEPGKCVERVMVRIGVMSWFGTDVVADGAEREEGVGERS